MAAAQAAHPCHVRAAAAYPIVDVVDVTPSGRPTAAREYASTVAETDCLGLGGGGKASPAAHVEDDLWAGHYQASQGGAALQLL